MSATIGHVGPNLPQRLLRATGRHAGPLDFDPDAPTPRAEAWMESKFAPWAKSILEGWIAGAYDGLEQVLFSRADDSAQRLYYYLCELQRRGLVDGPEPLILDIAKVPRATSIARTTATLRRLAERWEIDGTALGAAPGAAAPVPPADGKGCLLTGSPPPDLRLHDAISSAGFTPHGPTLRETWVALDEPLGHGGDPFDLLARQVHSSPFGPRAFADAAGQLRGEIERTGAKAVVLWQIEEDEAQAWHLPGQRAALRESGVPHLVLTRRDWLVRDGAGEEIAAFLGGVAA